ncbi:ABC transporter ATP-binding protein [Rhodospirillaceae bacterium KN72]|uniref:ABC transporter ATP-binding protein n=1 Tax=Pacificispira spongiicola TaxID=2729598 RepID=A0A7Y0DYH4_9PROT|nr:ABC transporter transmembrane domain-containing protein [Pacificispira spongiicola]NMM43903.1 ABC transporter ATP-binding protein [Pacificispira spongiicola]
MIELVHSYVDNYSALVNNGSHWWVHTVLFFTMYALPLLLGAQILNSILPFLKRILIAKLASQRSGWISKASLGSYVLKHSWRRQIKLAVLATLSLPALYASLELPKVIINNAIESGHYPIKYLVFEITQTSALIILCILFLVVVGVHGFLKFHVNMQAGALAEHISRRLRLDISRTTFKKNRNKNGDLIPIIVQEVEPVAGFAAESIVLPLLQGGTFLTILTFMLVQDVVLGLAAMALLPIQIYIVPKFQRKINMLSRSRLVEVRELGERISERSGMSGEETRKIYLSYRVLQNIRIGIHKKKYLLKTINNFISQLTPFFFYTIGGYLVISGDLSLGALIAVLTAYKDIGAPLKEVFRYYQAQADANVRYSEIAPYLSRKPA